MTIKIKVYKCFQETYRKIYKDIVGYLYPGYNCNLVEYEVDEEFTKGKDGKTLNIQAQRMPKEKEHYVPRTVRVYEDDKLTHVVGISNKNNDDDKRLENDGHDSDDSNYHANSYIKQGIAQFFLLYFYYKENCPGVKFSFYLMDVDMTHPHNLFNLLTYRELRTVGFDILNLDKIDFGNFKELGVEISGNADIGYQSVAKYMYDVDRISKRKKTNNPSFMKYEEHEVMLDKEAISSFCLDKYVFTFKALSAQGYDNLLRIWCLKVLADKENKVIEFRLGKQYFDYDAPEPKISKKLTGPIAEVLDMLGIVIDDNYNTFLNERNKERDAYSKAKERNDPRDQNLFRNNLRKKDMPCRCAVCGIDDYRILKAAHIWPVASISGSDTSEIEDFMKVNEKFPFLNIDTNYQNDSFYKKYLLTNSGENGIWMCPNHHEYFDLDILVIWDKEKNQYYTNSALPHDDIVFNAFNLVEFDDYKSIDKEILTEPTKAFMIKRNEKILYKLNFIKSLNN